MHKIKLAWRILTGKAHVLEVSQETRNSVTEMADKFRLTVDSYLLDANELYVEQMEPYREMMHRESDLASQVREAMKDIEL